MIRTIFDIILWKAKTSYISYVLWHIHDICSIPKIEHICKYWPKTISLPLRLLVRTYTLMQQIYIDPCEVCYSLLAKVTCVHINVCVLNGIGSPFAQNGGDFYDSMAMGIVVESENHIFMQLLFFFLFVALHKSFDANNKKPKPITKKKRIETENKHHKRKQITKRWIVKTELKCTQQKGSHLSIYIYIYFSSLPMRIVCRLAFNVSISLSIRTNGKNGVCCFLK